MFPHVLIVMPVYNEARCIRQTLGAALDQDYPAGLIEIIVADGGSTDGTRQVIQELQANHPNLHLIDNPGKIVPTGLNAALLQGNGDIIVRVDGHTVIAPDYVRQCVETLHSSGADNVGGRMRANGQGRFGEAVAHATSSSFGVGGSRFHYSDEEEWVDTVYLGAWRRETFRRIGFFDEELVRDQDDEFNYRLREQGGKILLTPRIQSRYTVRSKPRTLWRQYFQYGFWKVRVLQKHPLQMRPRQFVPPIFVGILMAGGLGAFFSPLSRALFALVLGSYLLANLAASAWTASQRGWRHLALLPLAYTILHFSYGLGFLVGLVKFANRWDDKHGRVPKITFHSEGSPVRFEP